MTCPRCGVALEQYDERDKWRCKDCLGTLVGLPELQREIGRHAADVFEVTAHEAETNHKCPVCGGVMAPFALGDIELERCDVSGVVWFDPGELRDVRALPDPDDPGRFTEAMRRLVELGHVQRRDG
jgi:Zn-finger nucleic acid-binding protein